MVKPGLGLFTGRRKSSSNVLEEMAHVETVPSPDAAHADSGGFRLMSRTEVEKANERRKTLEREKSSSKFRFSTFGANGKGRVQSFEEESPGSSKRDSKSSNGTQFSASRPYNNGQHGSTSTLPSSTDASSDDNLFSSAPRPPIPQHNSSPSSSLSMNGFRKQLPSLPKSSHGLSSKKDDKQSRERSMTASSYASTAIPPKLEAGLDFGNSSFDDMFSDMNRKESPPEMSREAPGRSLLSEKRTFQPEPIKTYPKLEVEAPLKSWESRGSTENLMSSSHSDDESPPPPPPPHKYSSYAPVASESPTLPTHNFGDRDAPTARRSYMEKTSYRDSSPEQHPTQPTSLASSSANSLQTPASSRSSNYTNNTTPKASLVSNISTYTDHDDDQDLFAPVKAAPKSESRAAQKAPAHSIPEDQTPTVPANAPRPGAGRVLTQTEYLAMQRRANSQPPPDDDSDEDYEDEEEAIKKREEEEISRRKQQQMQFAREAMRRTTTTSANPSRPDGGAEDMMGFPSETSMKADEWEDEDVPLGILAQHGFPSQVRGRMPNQPANAMPSYIPDRPASAGATPSRAPGHLPAFARGLPADPHSSFIGGGLVQPMNRESMGFNGFGRGPMSVAGDSMAGGMGMHSPMMYQEAGMSQPSLVDQIQMRDMTKQKYMGGASQKKPEGGPFTGMLGQQMNTNGQPQHPTRMSQMPMNGMMNPMMGGQMGGQMPMMGMGMNQMGYSMPQGNDMMAMQQMQQMQQMIAMQQMQLQQMQAMQRPQTQDPRMSMAMPNGFGGNMMGNGSFLSVPGAMPNGMQNRPMSFMSGAQGRQQPMSNFMGPGPGYTPSIAPSERSNVGLSARYRPVVNNSDAHSTGTSTILQASSGASANKPNTIKGIIKPARPPPVEEDEDWSKMAARKSKFGFGSKKSQNNGLAELTKGLNI
ncbi:hypothetical protein HBI49_025440 [Parastagonospora nodorum]|nr:hypothetical protein HBH71_079820 [Parastagonospora nodorum]KAH5221846.1 hypothetical protein HBI62_134890 [Parastagonospora nodorum]KAH5366434.1 hypothetical protein HBI48_065450 [Parastagonospora nodorum]KAH5378598.1 hypothetical protein HBI49_025440 [Parastagonospora nodorum]KAH5477198.1 hypothetical protein HBI28_077020 [Parastagonospora nodorum]